uniref:Uncharacterized protein n=1 Tax=Arundo donax TaxID=35708 RepID=A0A0A9D8B3_ARUDO
MLKAGRRRGFSDGDWLRRGIPWLPDLEELLGEEGRPGGGSGRGGGAASRRERRRPWEAEDRRWARSGRGRSVTLG